MNTCFECGGKLKMIAKAGRLAESDNDLFEIPAELRLPTCISCGSTFEDEFTAKRIDNAISSQKSTNPGAKLRTLRWIDSQIRKILTSPRQYGGNVGVTTQILLMLQMRNVTISKGVDAQEKLLLDKFSKLLQEQHPDLDHTKQKAALLQLNMEEDLTPLLRVFADLWIHC
jgi:hypothetical protein